MRGVQHKIDNKLYTLPPPIHVDSMIAFTTVDVSIETCGTVLQDLIANIDGDKSWIVTMLMTRLKYHDPLYFDFRTITLNSCCSGP